jgi:hypothetical protein
LDICTQNQNTFYVDFFSEEPCHLSDNVEKYGKGRQATDGNMTLRMRLAMLDK